MSEKDTKDIKKNQNIANEATHEDDISIVRSSSGKPIQVFDVVSFL